MNKNWGRSTQRWELVYRTPALLTLSGTTAETVMASVVIQGGLLGAKGRLRVTPIYGANSSATDKVLRIKFGGVTIFQPSASTFDNLQGIRPPPIILQNTGVAAQIGPPLTMNGATSSNALGAYAIDTGVDQVLEFTGQLELGTDTLTLLFEVEVLVDCIAVPEAVPSTDDAAITNLTTGNNPVATAALAAVKAGTGRMRVLHVGDSTEYGQGAGTSTSGKVGCRALSASSIAAGKLAAAGIPANVQNVFGTGNWDTTADLALADPTLSIPAGWALGVSFTAGGNLLQSASPNVDILAWTPTTPVDRFRVRYPVTATAGVMEYSLDGTTWTDINQNGSSALASVTINATLGTNTLRLRRKSGGTVYLATLEAWNSAVNAIDMLNAGWRGSTGYNWYQTTNPWSAPGIIANVQPHLTIINLTINSTDLTDEAGDNAGNFETNFKARIQSLIDVAKVSGDVWLKIGNPAAIGSRTTANQELVRGYVYALAATNNLAVIDLFMRLGSWDAANTRSQMYDSLHPNIRGHAVAGNLEYVAMRKLG